MRVIGNVSRKAQAPVHRDAMCAFGPRKRKLHSRRLASRMLALILALWFAMPNFAFAEDLENAVMPETIVETVVADATSADSAEMDTFEEVVVEDIEPVVEALEEVTLGDPLPEDEAPVDVSANNKKDVFGEPFCGRIDVDGIQISVVAVAGAFPEGATLRVKTSSEGEAARAFEAAFGTEAYDHKAYRIEVLDEAGNIILPDYDKALPVVRVEGLELSDDARVLCYDWVERNAFEIGSRIDGRSAIEFPFLDSTVYDIVTLLTGDNTEEPTEAPTAEPTEEPAVEPTEEPAVEPTEAPTTEPTEAPTAEPTEAPTAEPTEAPTAEPTEEPTVEPTEVPTTEPTEEPTNEPTEEPTAEPTEEPAIESTEEPTTEPTEEPTIEPTEEPTIEPTEEPAIEPTEEPTTEPTEEPTAEPTEEPAIEPTETPISYPSQSFIGDAKGISVSVEAPEGAFPEGTTLRVDPVWDDATLSDIETAVSGDYIEVKRVHAVNITFLDAEGMEIEPLLPISVVMSVDEIERQQEAVVVHVDDSGNAEVVDRAEESAVAFEADAFSVYALVVTETVERVVKASDGNDYRITVSYGPEAGIPDGTTLEVVEIDDPRLYIERAADALRVSPDSISYSRLFDITLLTPDGEEAQPLLGTYVDVSVTLDDAGADMDVVHFGQEAQEVTANAEGGAVSFAAEGFSVYGFFTVDFFYGEYEYHLPGEEQMLLSELFVLLGIEADVTNVTSVTFSSPEYLAVEPVENDWQLTSLAPFDTDETLTVRMRDGEIVVLVRDAGADSNTKLIVKYIGNGHFWSAGTSNTYAREIGEVSLGAGAKIDNQNVMKGLTTYTMAGSSGKSGGYDGSVLPTNYTWAWVPGTGETFVGYVFNKDSFNCTGDTRTSPDYTALELYSKITKWGFIENTTIIGVFKREDTSFVYYTTDGNGSISGGNTTDFLTWNYKSDGTGATATPNAGYEFDHWEYNGAQYSGETFNLSNVTADGVVRAVFKELPKVTYTYERNVINATGNINNEGKTDPSSELVTIGSIPGGSTATNNNRYFCAWFDKDTGEFITTDSNIMFNEPALKDRNFIAVFTSVENRLIAYSNVPEAVKWNQGDDNQGKETLFWAGKRYNDNRFLNNAQSMTYEIASGYMLDYAVLNGTTVQAEDIQSGSKLQGYVNTNVNNNGLNTLILYVRPEGTKKITYVSSEGGTVSNSQDFYENGNYPKGSTATAKSGYSFIGWQDENSNIVSTNSTFVPSWPESDVTYTALFNNENNRAYYTTNDPSLVKAYARTNSGKLDESNRVIVNTYASNNSGLTYSVWNGTENATALKAGVAGSGSKLIKWELTYSDGHTEDYITADNGIKPSEVYLKDGAVLKVIKAIVVPDDAKLINYAVMTGTTLNDETGGTITNRSDYAGSLVAYGSGAIPNTDEEYSFLGWYTVLSNETEFQLSDSPNVTAGNLQTWLTAGYIHQENQTIYAKFDKGYKITYLAMEDDTLNTDSPLFTEAVHQGENVVGFTAPDKDEYNFRGWYRQNGEKLEFVTSDFEIGKNLITGVAENRTYVAKYASATTAAFTAEYLNQGKEGVSYYGYVAVGEDQADTVTTIKKKTNDENKLAMAVTAEPARGCEFVKWDVTEDGVQLSDDAVKEKFGFEATSLTIPEGTQLSKNTVFKAQFQKASGSIEVIYNIQADYDTTGSGANTTLAGKSFAAKLTVGDKSVEGKIGTASLDYEEGNAFISEVVPASESALGCSAEGTVGTEQYRIIGWALGQNVTYEENTSDRDNFFTRSSFFIPSGEYLEDIDGNSVRYFRVITKKEKNIYIVFKVNNSDAGYVAHSSGTQNSVTDQLIYLNDTSTKIGASNVFPTTDSGLTSQQMGYYGAYVNSGYKIIGFTFNGVNLDLQSPLSAAQKFLLNSDKLKVVNPDDESTTIDLVTYIKEHSKLALDSENVNDVTDSDHINVLVVIYASDDFNIEYFVKDGIGGDVSNYADGFTSVDKTENQADSKIKGSTAIADAANDYVFDHWEDEDGNTVGTESTYFDPQAKDITVTGKVYKFYAVFKKNLWLKIDYVSEDSERGSVSFDSETVSISDTIKGSTAKAETGWVFDHWTLKDGDTKISETAVFTPANPDNITDSDYKVRDEMQTITFVAHFKKANETKINVTKSVGVDEVDGIDKSTINTTIYVCLQLKKESVTEEEFSSYVSSGIVNSDGYVLDSTGKVFYKAIDIDNGTPSPTTVSYEGLPYGTYDVWEMHKVTEGEYVSQYVGMPITEDYKLSAIAVDNPEKEKNNNAYITSVSPSTTVSFENTYASPDSAETFRAKKEWLGDGGSTGAPDGASVVFTIYSEINGVTTAVKSVTLDGQVDAKAGHTGETVEWTATFANLPALPEGGKYKVRETAGYKGYTAYVDGAKKMTANVYLERENGKITNIKDDIDDLKGTLKFTKSFAVPSAYEAHKAAIVDGTYTFELKGVEDTATINETITLTASGGVVTGASISGGSYTATLDTGTGVVTIANLPIGEYTLKEKNVADTVTKTIGGGSVTFNWIVEGDGNLEIGINEDTSVTVANKYTLPSLTISKTVAGSMGDPNEAFTFTLSVAGSSASYAYTKTKKDGAKETGDVSGNDGTFILSDGDTIVIDDLPIGVNNITVSEANGYYTTSWQVGEGGSTQGDSITITMDADKTLAVTNTLNAVSPTGVNARNGPYLLMLLLAIGLAALTLASRRGELRDECRIGPSAAFADGGAAEVVAKRKADYGDVPLTGFKRQTVSGVCGAAAQRTPPKGDRPRCRSGTPLESDGG